jgi:hypothetical protein
VGEECRFRRNGLEAGQAITLAGPVDVGGLALLCCIDEDLMKIDPGRGCRYGRERLKRDARTDPALPWNRRLLVLPAVGARLVRAGLPVAKPEIVKVGGRTLSMLRLMQPLETCPPMVEG